ncbi:hypothetical protein BpHYR1_007421 [Brachionus plicatilis]|uniref:Uncharacterized protein n=1 Tax=Brachionus plicatilis TaxID=10195 RepID=A0A3M7SLQ9_BRAPC|nr:hypothetical protein BpHYR1_007421 [Brachionus plicatilis]
MELSNCLKRFLKKIWRLFENAIHGARTAPLRVCNKFLVIIFKKRNQRRATKIIPLLPPLR